MFVNSLLEPLIHRIGWPNNKKQSSHRDLLKLISEASLLSDNDIESLINSRLLIIEPYHPSLLNQSSIDLSLGSLLVKYIPQTISLGRSKPKVQEIDICDSDYEIKPGEFILGTTNEKVYIPDGYQGVIETKGNIARAGLEVHSNDGHIDPGFCGQITLEIANLHRKDVSIKLVPGTPICQLFIGKLSSPCNTLYRGKYLNQEKPTVYCP